MKKLLLSLLVIGSLAQASTITYIPQTGPLMLADTSVMPSSGAQRGIIMNIIMTDPDFAVHKNNIISFLATYSKTINTTTYQEMMQLIGLSTNSALATSALCAFEQALMHHYHYERYMIGSYKPGVSIFFTGIPSLQNPFKSDTEFEQVMKELARIGSVAKRHSPVMAQRIALTVESYRHWKRNLIITALAACALDIYSNGLERSNVNIIHEHGLSVVPLLTKRMVLNMRKNLYRSVQTIGSWIKPTTDKIMYGAQGAPVEKNKQFEKMLMNALTQRDGQINRIHEELLFARNTIYNIESQATIPNLCKAKAKDAATSLANSLEQNTEYAKATLAQKARNCYNHQSTVIKKNVQEFATHSSTVLKDLATQSNNVRLAAWNYLTTQQ